MIYYAIHVAAKNDVNGNPRRAFMVYDPAGNLVGTVDEGYAGNQAVARSGLLPEGATLIVLARVDTTPGYYRDAKREAGPMPSRDKGPAERAAERIFCSTNVPDKTIPGFAAIIAEEYRPLVEALENLLGYCERYSDAGPGDWEDFRKSSMAKKARAALGGKP